ncbi:MAG: hypothetical protein QOE53_1313 [Pseudonocardiales bacterium]|jgi:hypothetical protein|nr:hypothetical protein [Pseudonocardiales bacterium]
MFEEVPRERRGVARLLPLRRVVLGPFVLGGGMLLAAVGGSVAVAAAATMITASAIGSDDAPARPSHPGASASSTQQTLAARRPPVRHQRPTPVAPTAAGLATVARPSGPAPAAGPGSTSAALPAPSPAATTRPPDRSAGPTATPSSPVSSASPTPAPPTSAPLGNAVIHVSRYDQASERLAYQFAAVQPGAGIGGRDLYQVIDSDTFTAALAPSVTITSGGGICPPAGSACTVDQLIGAADSGFFAVVAIDARGELRSIIEVGDQSPAPKLIPGPGAGGSHPGGTSPSPSSTPVAVS